MKVKTADLLTKKLTMDDAVKFHVTEKKLVITKSGPTLEELLGQCNPENRHQEYFCESQGKEML